MGQQFCSWLPYWLPRLDHRDFFVSVEILSPVRGSDLRYFAIDDFLQPEDASSCRISYSARVRVCDVCEVQRSAFLGILHEKKSRRTEVSGNVQFCNSLPLFSLLGVAVEFLSNLSGLLRHFGTPNGRKHVLSGTCSTILAMSGDLLPLVRDRQKSTRSRAQCSSGF